jgi:hypothetical protein
MGERQLGEASGNVGLEEKAAAARQQWAGLRRLPRTYFRCWRNVRRRVTPGASHAFRGAPFATAAAFFAPQHDYHQSRP